MPPQCLITSSNDVPILTSKFLGSLIPLPATVSRLSISGIPVIIAFETAKAVATLFITTPTSIGSPPDGTSRSKTDFITCFSAPCEYIVLRATTSIPGIFAVALIIDKTASLLLSSIATIPFETPKAFIIAFMPSTILSASSSISL